MENTSQKIIDGVTILTVGHAPADCQAWDEDSLLRFKVWCLNTRTSYYSSLNDEFQVSEAVKLAKSEGNHRVIVDNLS